MRRAKELPGSGLTFVCIACLKPIRLNVRSRTEPRDYNRVITSNAASTVFWSETTRETTFIQSVYEQGLMKGFTVVKMFSTALNL